MEALENDFKELKEKLKQQPNNKDFLEKEKLLLGLQKAMQEKENLLLKKEPTEVTILPGFYENIRDCKPKPIPWKNSMMLSDDLQDLEAELNAFPSEDPGVSVATLQENKWLCVDSKHLFIRSCYPKLWAKMDSLYQNYLQQAKDRRKFSVLLLGNPGIGKTVSMNYFLMQALKKNYPVLFETRRERFFFHDGIAEMESIEGSTLRKLRNDPRVLLLHDHQQNQPPPFCKAFTIAAMLPDSSNYSEYRKDTCSQLWMPLPSHHDLIAMNSVEPKLETQELLDRLDLFGPIPRYVFSDEPDVMRQLLESRISSFDYEKCRRLGMLTSGELPKSHDGLSWTVLHVSSESEELQHPTKISWASDHVMVQVLEKHTRTKMLDLESSIAALLGDKTSLHQPDGEFQHWSCQRIASGCKIPTFVPFYNTDGIKTQSLRPCPQPSIQLEPHNMVPSRTLPAVKDMVRRKGKLIYATIVNEPLCDAAVITNNSLVLFQMIIGENHTVKERTFKSYCNKAKEHGLACVRFVFVVPHKNQFLVSEDQVTFFQRPSLALMYLWKLQS
eukprot:TRINITY_DN5095_c0_g1_i5.p1 TRINITY_DN5095_c0_g1~~TRINITY_DN5095_c0_g1_i5.p1  ORF type:complete len:556 (-),score=82.98 TRINITY_DN5095_c0_g1_i5:1290-2957(-)